jgi:hypothetical protein
MFPTQTSPPSVIPFEFQDVEPVWNPSIHLVQDCGPKKVTYVNEELGDVERGW